MANEAALPAVAAVLETSTFLSDYNRELKRGLRYLKDKMFTFNSTASSVYLTVSTLTHMLKM